MKASVLGQAKRKHCDDCRFIGTKEFSICDILKCFIHKVNSGLFTSLDRVKMLKRASDKPQKQILKHISDSFKTDSK